MNTRRQKAIDFMFRDFAYVGGQGFQEDQTDEQIALTRDVMELASNPTTPLHIVYELGDLLRKAKNIGYQRGYREATTARRVAATVVT